MPQTPVRAHVEMSFDVCGYVTPQIAFDFYSLINDLADFDHIIVGQVITLQVQRNSGLAKYLSRTAMPNSVNIGQCHFHSLAPWKIDSCNTRHGLSPIGNLTVYLPVISLTLPLLMLGVYAQNSHHSFAADNFTFIADLFY
jgi:hypothetical protein